MRPTQSCALIGAALVFCFSATISIGQVDSVVVFNEIHYHPADDHPGQEFIELFNQNSVNVDLTGWSLEGAGEYLFEKGMIIEARSYLILAKDPDALGVEGALGPLSGALANNGERLTLRNHNGRIMDQIDFRDSRPWPTGADGSGATLSKRQPLTSSGPPENWTASRGLGGTPGRVNDDLGPASRGVVISEIPASTEESFWVEVTNASDAAIDLSGLELVDGTGGRFPLSSSLDPGAYRQVALDLEASEGLRLFLIDAEASSFLDAVIVQDEPRARVTFPDGRFLHPDALTPGAANEVSFDDSVVINEIMYHHRPHYRDPDDPESVYRENEEEWIELVNRSDAPVDLTGWRFRDAVEFDFEEGTVLQPGAFLVVANDAAALAGKHPDIDIVGDFRGSLANGSDCLELQDPRGNPADTVRYYDGAPWPIDADGGGSSLELKHPGMDNSAAEAWAASDESLKSDWHTYRYRAVAARPVYTAGVRSFHELRLGYIEAGSCLVDNVSVVEDPDGAKLEIARNRTFGSLFAPTTSSNWRLVGNHHQSAAVMDPDAGAVLKIVAESSMNYLNNICEGSLTKEVEIGTEYEVSFDAKWLAGSPQLRSEVYYNKFAKKHILIMPEKHGTPGAQNTAYVENPGPTYQGLRHDPPVPDASETITVTVSAQDPEGVDTMTLHYSVDEDDWQSAPMVLQEGEVYRGVIPAQASGAVIQFYVEGTDGSGGLSTYPADGRESGAFVRVDSLASTDRRQSMRLIVRDSDSRDLHDALLILSNARKDCTVIMNETDITYGCGVRQRGSMFSRSGAGAGLNIKFPSNEKFRGTQSTVIVRWRNPQEILVKHMANQAGGVPASYNDFLEFRGYRSGQPRLVRMEMARFGTNYLDGAFENGSAAPVFKMEGIRDFQQAGPGGIKRPMPIGWIVQYDLADLGDDKEQYRHVLRMINARKEDDYSAMLAMSKAFGAPDEVFRERIEAVLDVDQWARMMAVQTLCGIADVYPVENPHNFNFYRRPTDQKIVAIPWDWDFTFNLGASSRIIDPRSSRKNLWRLLEEPGINRLFRGHLLDVIDTIFNEGYARTWFTHYGEVAGSNYGSHITYIRSRGNNVKGQAGSQTPFRILTNDGADLTVDTAQVTLQGKAGVRVRTIEVVETGLSLEPHWVDDETWELTLPLDAEVNAMTLQARDYQGTKGSLFSPTGSAKITVTNTSSADAPQPSTLLISEIMYHPEAPSDEERAAGFDDQDLFEFVELTNIGARGIELRTLKFTNGIAFDFSSLADKDVLEPGEVVVLAANAEAFAKRYGDAIPVLGQYTGNLSNGGERLTLTAANERVIQDIAYDDREPWVETADGEGFSLTLAELTGSLDAGAGESWRTSNGVGGSPGVLETAVEGLSFDDWVTEQFSEAEVGEEGISGRGADPDEDDLPNAVEYALGLSPKQSDSAVVSIASLGDQLRLAYPRASNRKAELSIERSLDLEAWEELPAVRQISQKSDPLPGGERVTTTVSRGEAGEYLRLRVTLSP